MNIMLSVPVACVIVGIACGVINNSWRAHDFWFWLALLTAVIVRASI